MSTTGTTTEPVDTRSQAEYNGLCNERSSASSQIDASEARIADYEAKIELLETAYSSVKTVKDNIEEQWRADVKKCYNDYNDDGYEWAGKAYDEVESEVSQFICWHFEDIIDNIDDVLDEINLEITRYENLIIEEEGILVGLRTWWNNLCTRIANYWN